MGIPLSLLTNASNIEENQYSSTLKIASLLPPKSRPPAWPFWRCQDHPTLVGIVRRTAREETANRGHWRPLLSPPCMSVQLPLVSLLYPPSSHNACHAWMGDEVAFAMHSSVFSLSWWEDNSHFSFNKQYFLLSFSIITVHQESAELYHRQSKWNKKGLQFYFYYLPFFFLFTLKLSNFISATAEDILQNEREGELDLSSTKCFFIHVQNVLKLNSWKYLLSKVSRSWTETVYGS